MGQLGRYVPGRVTLDGKHIYEAHVLEDERWNGFVCPVFSRELGRQICADVLAQEEFAIARYEPNFDRFVFGQVGDPIGECDLFDGFDVEGLGHMYAIGAFAWTWWDATVEDDEEDPRE